MHRHEFQMQGEKDSVREKKRHSFVVNLNEDILVKK